MDIKATMKYVRISPTKARGLARRLRGLPLQTMQFHASLDAVRGDLISFPEIDCVYIFSTWLRQNRLF